MRGRDVLFVAFLCFVFGLMIGIEVSLKHKKNNTIDSLIKERDQFNLLLENSRKERDRLLKKNDSLKRDGTVIVEKIKKIPVYVHIPYDTMGSSKLRQLMIQEYKKAND